MSKPVASTSTSTAPISLERVITPIDEFVTDMYDRIEGWENGGARRARFEAEQGPQVTVAYEAFFADVADHLAALEDPLGMTGRPDYGPAEMLVDLRHLRDMNKNNVRSGSSALARRLVMHPGVWGLRSDFTDHDPRIAGTVPAQAYIERMDSTAYRLAKAINDTARLERELAAEAAKKVAPAAPAGQPVSSQSPMQDAAAEQAAPELTTEIEHELVQYVYAQA